MYWLNVSRLAEGLREGRVDEKERFKYFLATFAALSIVLPVFFYSVGPLSIDDRIYLIVSAVMGVVGIFLWELAGMTNWRLAQQLLGFPSHLSR